MLKLIEKIWNEREEKNMLKVQSVVWEVLLNLERNVYRFMSLAHTPFLLLQWRGHREADLLLTDGFEAILREKGVEKNVYSFLRGNQQANTV